MLLLHIHSPTACNNNICSYTFSFSFFFLKKGISITQWKWDYLTSVSLNKIIFFSAYVIQGQRFACVFKLISWCLQQSVRIKVSSIFWDGTTLKINKQFSFTIKVFANPRISQVRPFIYCFLGDIAKVEEFWKIPTKARSEKESEMNN